MALFNSLGSNYSTGFAWKYLYRRGSRQKHEQIKDVLGEHYGGTVALTYKGRQALELALRRSGLPKGGAVAINGFTCYAVYLAVQNAGYMPVFVDIEPSQLNFTAQKLQTVHQIAPDLKAVIIQNTLGYPCDMPAIEAYCRANGLMIIEDLAHSVGTNYSDGREAGTVGDFTMLSFSQDKPLDVVAGGALIDRHAKTPAEEITATVPIRQQLINRFYPFWTSHIRTFYTYGLGRYLHFALKKLHWLATPMSDNIHGIFRMTTAAEAMLPERIAESDAEIAHRRAIGAIYEQQLPKELQLVTKPLGVPTYLRFPIQVHDRAALVAYLKANLIYIGDTWYDVPIGPKKYFSKTSYEPGECPVAEVVAEHIVNLPTHRYVTPEKAQDICDKIAKWMKLPQKS